MSKFATAKHLNADDFKDSPQWFRDYLESYNVLVDSLNAVLVSGIDIPNNLRAEQTEITVTHNVPINVRMQRLKTTPSFVAVGYAEGFVGYGAITGYLPDGTVTLTVTFLGTIPTRPVKAMCWFM